jgi:hypothetical protein
MEKSEYDLINDVLNKSKNRKDKLKELSELVDFFEMNQIVLDLKKELEDKGFECISHDSSEKKIYVLIKNGKRITVYIE